MQLAGNVGVHERGSQVKRLSGMKIEQLIDKVMQAPCISLQNIGLDKDVVRGRLIQWATADQEQPAHMTNNVTAQVWQGAGARSHPERMHVQGSVVMVKSGGRYVEIDGYALDKVLIDTGAEPVLVGRRIGEALALYGGKLEDCEVKNSTAAGTSESIMGRTKNPVRVVLNPRRARECVISVKCLVTDATSYDVLLGAAATYKPALGVDPYREIAFYRPKWEMSQ